MIRPTARLATSLGLLCDTGTSRLASALCASCTRLMLQYSAQYTDEWNTCLDKHHKSRVSERHSVLELTAINPEHFRRSCAEHDRHWRLRCLGTSTFWGWWDDTCDF